MSVTELLEQAPLAEVLKQVRKRWKLTKSEMLRRIQAQGLPYTTFATYTGWESGVEPKPLYRIALEAALKRIEQTLARR